MASHHCLCRFPMKALHEHPHTFQLVLAADPPYPPSISCLKLMTTDRSVMARVTDLLTIKNVLRTFRYLGTVALGNLQPSLKLCTNSHPLSAIAIDDLDLLTQRPRVGAPSSGGLPDQQPEAACFCRAALGIVIMLLPFSIRSIRCSCEQCDAEHRC